MGTTTFSGPVKSGTVREGASANVGTVSVRSPLRRTQSKYLDPKGIFSELSQNHWQKYLLAMRFEVVACWLLIG